jgi:sterol desaturase/sphingolipid hydroxylase (fatty acid hydroxylase superfamily)
MTEVMSWHALTTVIFKLALGFVLFLVSTVVFDVVHWTLHQLSASRFGALRRIGELHAAHHAFLTRELRHDEDYVEANLRLHVIPEFLTQLTVSGLLLLVLPLSVVGSAIFLQVLVFGLIMKARGKDINHVEVDRLNAYQPLYFCTPPYHRLHHVYPGAYFSSWIKTFDHVAGTGVDLCDRSIAMIGTGGDFGEELRTRLEAFRRDPIEILDDALPDLDALEAADIVVLAGDPLRFEEHVERIGALSDDRRFPMEVWAMAPEKGDGFERRGRELYSDPRMIYRHIATAPRNGAHAREAGKAAFFFIQRGFNWVPSRFSPEMVREYLKFRRLTTGASSTTLSRRRQETPG